MSLRITLSRLGLAIAALFQPRSTKIKAEEKKPTPFELTDDEAEDLQAKGW